MRRISAAAALAREARALLFSTTFTTRGGEVVAFGRRAADGVGRRRRRFYSASASSSSSSTSSSSSPSSWFAPIVGTLGLTFGCLTLGMEYQKRTERAMREALGGDGGGGGGTETTAPPLPSSKTEPTGSTTTTTTKEKKEKKEKKDSSSGNGSVPKSEADLLFNLHNKARTVFVTGTIDDRLSHRVVAQLVHLNNENPKLPIVMVINSGGGVVTSGYAILDTMKALDAPIVTYAVGHAESMAAILLAGGEKGRRFCAPNARIMIHQPHHSMSGMTSDILIKATKAEETRNALTMSLVETTGKTFEEVEKALDRNTYLFAESAKEFGIVDRVCVNWKDLTSEKEEEKTKGKKGEEKEKKVTTTTAASTSPRVSGGRGIGQKQQQQQQQQQQKKEDKTKEKEKAPPPPPPPPPPPVTPKEPKEQKKETSSKK
jgi:ATP-dependent Clp protease protease subunit